jgi:hypothetical protein
MPGDDAAGQYVGREARTSVTAGTKTRRRSIVRICLFLVSVAEAFCLSVCSWVEVGCVGKEGGRALGERLNGGYVCKRLEAT